MPCGNLTAVCGWSELISGNVVGSAFTMLDNALGGWVVAILFLVYQVMLLIKTQNLTLSWVTGIIFISLYVTSTIVKTISVQIIALLLILELGGILYFAFMK